MSGVLILARPPANRLSDSGAWVGRVVIPYAIIPKIREVDSLLRGNAKARRAVREVHPEICFCELVDRVHRSPIWLKRGCGRASSKLSGRVGHRFCAG